MDKATFLNTTAANSAIRDNRSRGTIGDFLNEKIKDNSKLSFVSAYFTIFAYDKLKEKLDNINSLDFLFGEPKFINSLDPEKNKPKSFGIEDNNLELKERLVQKSIAKECSEWIRDKVNIKSIRNFDFLHGKMYHIDNNGIDDAIIGSSNFTVRGMGLNEQSNIELNLEVNDKRDREDLKKWFYEIWNNEELVEDVKQKVLDYLEQLYVDTPPEFLYFKTLYHIFEDYLEDEDRKTKIDEKIRVIDSEIWKTLFEFQKDGAKGAINKLLKHNGCILADSVGLGKTYTSLAVIKYFELLNYRVLVLCPKRLNENWTIFQASNNDQLNPFLKDKFGYTVLSHTDLNRFEGYAGNINLSSFNWSNFDLVVIDESHNFRNNTPGKEDDEGKYRKSRYERLMDDIIQSGVKTKVLLLSATPVNNQLKDLRNQVSLITSEDYTAFKDSLDINNYAEMFRVAQLNFTQWAKREKRDVRDLLNSLDSAFFKLLDALTIARSRKHIKRYYDLKKIGHFPDRAKPIPIYPAIDLNDLFMSYDKLNDEISQYQLSLFNPTKYLKDDFEDLYQGKVKAFRQEDREYFLIGMMKVNFMKRLESLVHSFAISLDRTINKIGELEKKLKAYKEKQKDGELDFDETKIEDLDDEELQEANQVGKKIKFNLAHLKTNDWLKDLAKDKKQLHSLYLSANDVTPERDAKLADLK
ncbi:MAG: SNF2-related protein, partial [Ignavibacteriaceae bacterium]